MQKIQASSPQAQSADLVGDNIAQLKKLFPELLTENAHGVAVNVDVLKALVGDKTAAPARCALARTRAWIGRPRRT